MRSQIAPDDGGRLKSSSSKIGRSKEERIRGGVGGDLNLRR